MIIEKKAHRLDKEYEKALQDPDYRPSFLNVIDLTPIARYVRGMVYVNSDDVSTFTDTPLIAATGPSVRSKLHIPRGRHSIYVFPPAFSPREHPTVEDFLGTILDHEGFHAMEMFERPGTIVCPVWSDIADFFAPPEKKPRMLAYYEPAEARALKNVLANPAGRAFSPEYLARVQRLQGYFSIMSEFDAKKSMPFSDR